MKTKILIVSIVLMLLVSPVSAAKGSEVVIFPDDSSGIVEWSTRNGRNPFIMCSYFAPAYSEYLGRFGSNERPIDPLGFCLDNYANRVQ